MPFFINLVVLEDSDGCILLMFYLESQDNLDPNLLVHISMGIILLLGDVGAGRFHKSKKLDR